MAFVLWTLVVERSYDVENQQVIRVIALRSCQCGIYDGYVINNILPCYFLFIVVKFSMLINEVVL